MDKVEEVLAFWFEGFNSPDDMDSEKVWRFFSSTPEFNDQLRAKFGEDLVKAGRGDYDCWADTPRGALALTIICDQFTRNLFPDSPENVSNDPKAVAVAREAVNKGFDKDLWPIQKLFFYLPFEHAEDMELQRLSLQKFDENIAQSEGSIKSSFENFRYYSHLHYIVIEKYGRFPGRNKMLGRVNTPEEDEYLRNDPDGF